MLTNNSPENILHTAYEAKMISSGDNSPSIKIKFSLIVQRKR
ncbi:MULTISPECIES: hypothetical protein [Bacillus cereus group]|nr:MULTISPECIES: hypothetical protein [Bacillus cereus group]MCU4899851.1 hypothetical protein [Bacillus cereus]MCU5313194.1 hypothetical protein [Bacillus cereus]MCU5483682.1 hypothetical protein [Bacillus cereus]